MINSKNIMYAFVLSLFIVILIMNFFSSDTTVEENENKALDAKKTQESKTSNSIKNKTFKTSQVSMHNAGITNEEVLLKEGGYKIDEDVALSAIDKLIGLSGQRGSNDFKARNVLKQELVNLAKSDTAALDELLNAYADNLDNDDIQNELFQVLSQINNAKVEALAHDLALSSDRDSQISGFDLLSELKIPSEENLNLSLDTLSQSQGDKELTLSALHALTKMPLSQEDNENVVNKLSELTRSQDEAIRSESLLSIASWAKNEDDLSAVTQALNSEVDDDKISAAMALERSPVTGDKLKAVLLQKIQNDNELWEVRSMSANALGRFDLSESEFLELQNFRKAQTSGVAN